MTAPRLAQVGRVGWALLRVGFAETVAYRFALLVWVLAATMPLVNLALWGAVAGEAPVGRFTQGTFAAYFLGALAIRQITGSSVSAMLDYEIRSGQLAIRLLRPIHPLFCYGVESLASLPLRAAPALFIAGVGLWMTESGLPPMSLGRFTLFFAATALAFVLNFFLAVAIGAIAFFLESSAAIAQTWQIAFLLMSGYIVPLELLPASLHRAAAGLPFYYMMAFPLEIWLFTPPPDAVLRGLLVQSLWIVLSATGGIFAWQRGVRRFAVYGG